MSKFVFFKVVGAFSSLIIAILCGYHYSFAANYSIYGLVLTLACITVFAGTIWHVVVTEHPLPDTRMFEEYKVPATPPTTRPVFLDMTKAAPMVPTAPVTSTKKKKAMPQSSITQTVGPDLAQLAEAVMKKQNGEVVKG